MSAQNLPTAFRTAVQREWETLFLDQWCMWEAGRVLLLSRVPWQNRVSSLLGPGTSALQSVHVAEPPPSFPLPIRIYVMVYPAAPFLLLESSLQTKVSAVLSPSPQELLILPFTLLTQGPVGNQNSTSYLNTANLLEGLNWTDSGGYKMEKRPLTYPRDSNCRRQPLLLVRKE